MMRSRLPLVWFDFNVWSCTLYNSSPAFFLFLFVIVLFASAGSVSDLTQGELIPRLDFFFMMDKAGHGTGPNRGFNWVMFLFTIPTL